jgi:hypothetical protein
MAILYNKFDMNYGYRTQVCRHMVETNKHKYVYIYVYYNQGDSYVKFLENTNGEL